MTQKQGWRLALHLLGIIGSLSIISIMQLVWVQFLTAIIRPMQLPNYPPEQLNALVICLSMIASSISIYGLLIGWLFWRHGHKAHRTPSKGILYSHHYLGLVTPKTLPLPKILVGFLVLYLAGKWLMGEQTQPAHMIITLMQTKPSYLVFFALVVAAPICEELVFRGLLWRLLGKLCRHLKHPILLTSGIISLLFGLSHLHYPPPQITLVVGFSLLFCYARWRCQSLLVPLLLHIINNALAWFAWQHHLG